MALVAVNCSFEDQKAVQINCQTWAGVSSAVAMARLCGAWRVFSGVQLRFICWEMKVYVTEWIKLNEAWISFSLDEMCARNPWLCLCNWKKVDKGSEALSHLLWHSWCPCAEILPLHQAECLHLNFLLGTSLSMCYQPNCGPALAVRVNWHWLNNSTECTGQLRQL